MNLTELKYKPLDKHSQIVIFNKSGDILDSDNKLVNVTSSKHNIFDDSLFSGMEDTISKISDGEELTYDCIETDLFGRTSHYDFILKKLSEEGEQERYGWIIYDFGTQYNKIFELQQERNIAEIQAKKAEREVGKLKEEKQTIEKLYQDLLADTSQEYILVKSDNLLVNLDFKEINYFEAYGDYIKVYTTNKMYITYNTMKNVEGSLPENQFFRIHRSYIVRLDKINNIEQLSVEIDGKALPIGKSYKAMLIQKMGQL